MPNHHVLHYGMICRDINEELALCAREYPIVTVTGPRQAGKTTLARQAFPDLAYVSFEQPLAREQFYDDPLAFLQRYHQGAIFDEVQHVPDLLSYLQQDVDEDPSPGRFILTGSQHFGLSQQVSQSLAGRTAVLELFPFSINEMRRGKFLADTLDTVLWQGAYPRVHDRGLRAYRWYATYMATYIDRDVRQLTAVHDLDTFHRFMRLTAGNVGQLVNTSRLADDCGVDHKTVRRWLDILQTSYVAHLLPPYYQNFRKRIVKTPKLYFYDTGLVCYLLGIHNPEQLTTHPLRGAVFENWVFAELTKLITNSVLPNRLYFWRTHGGQEVDFLLEYYGDIIGVEVKAGMTPRPGMSQSLLNALQHWSASGKKAFVVFGGDESFVSRECRFLPWHQIHALLETGEFDKT